MGTAAMDRFHNVYYATEDNELVKLSKDLTRIGYYSNHIYGKIGIIDPTNPLKLLLYYTDFYTAVILDRRLNEQGTFNMLDLGFGEIRTMASSLDGNLWLFDDHMQRILKIDHQGEILQRGEDLRLKFDDRLLPTRMIETNGKLYAGIPGRGILIFDLFGNYLTQILFPELEDFQLASDLVFVKTSQGYQSYDVTTFETRIIAMDLPDNAPNQVLFNENGTANLLTDTGIEQKKWQ